MTRPLPQTARPVTDARLYAQEALEALRAEPIAGASPLLAVPKARAHLTACLARLDEALEGGAQ